MPQMYFPTGPRSATAVEGKSDIRDENIYSAVVLQHSGSGTAKLFTVPQGQAIPKLNGTVTASTNAHHTNYSEVSTNFQKAGEPGSNIGDLSVVALGVTFEQAAYTPTTGAARSFGATAFEVADCLAKCFLQLKVGNKDQIMGPIWAFPATGGATGSISTTGTNQTASIVNNGWPGGGRRLNAPILIARNDTVVCVFGVGGTASLANNVTSSDGQPYLAWVNLRAGVRGDVR